MDYSRFSYVRPLESAQNMFLEVLLTRFTLLGRRTGAELIVEFDEKTQAIWNDQGRSELRSGIPDFDAKSARYQAELDSLLLGGSSGSFHHDDADFPFRYVSGGTLPVITLKGRDYYCLSYREIPPVGWNIANGGSDTHGELLDPVGVIERELREELIAFDASRRKLFVYGHAGGRPRQRPESEAASRLWRARGYDLCLPPLDKMDEEVVGIGYIDGPDTLHVRTPGEPEAEIGGIFLNVNALDFGIEVDKIGKIAFPTDDLRIFDGESVGADPINAPVGLFDVDKLNKAIIDGETTFIPDRLFYDSLPIEGNMVGQIADTRFIPRMARRFGWDRRVWDEAERKFDLCPVTRRIIQRYMLVNREASLPEQRPAAGHYDVFISFPYEEDAIQMAQALSDRIRSTGRTVFFSRELDSSHFVRAINRALVSANCFVAVLTHPEQVYRNWVEHECTTFLSLMMNGQKPANAQMLSLVSFDPRRLLPPLAAMDAEMYDPARGEASLERVMRYVLSAPAGSPLP